jgi:hypothetical protein
MLVKNVLSVPKLKGNLLTVKRLIDLGLNVNCGNNKCDIVANGKVIATMTINTDEKCSVLQEIKN